jgi:hypothetical protein
MAAQGLDAETLDLLPDSIGRFADRNLGRLEATRAHIEATAARLDAGEGALNTEGVIAKYRCTDRHGPGQGPRSRHP